MRNTLDLLGRLALSALFLNEAYNCIARPKHTMGQMAAYGITWNPELLLWTSAALLVLGSVLLVIGYRSRLAAVLLLMYWLPLCFVLDPFWQVPADEVRLSLLGLMRNLAIAGALLLVVAHGTGAYAVRKVLASAKS